MPSSKNMIGHNLTLSYRKPGALEESVGVCSLHLKESDGKTKGAWLLTEIDHWDVEKERIFILTECE